LGLGTSLVILLAPLIGSRTTRSRPTADRHRRPASAKASGWDASRPRRADALAGPRPGVARKIFRATPV